MYPKSALNATNSPPKPNGNGNGNTKTKKNNSGTTKNNSTPTKFSLGTNANIAARQKREVEYQKQLGRTSNEQSFLNTQKEEGKLLDFKPKTPETPSNNATRRLEEVHRLTDKDQKPLSRKNEELTP